MLYETPSRGGLSKAERAGWFLMWTFRLLSSIYLNREGIWSLEGTGLLLNKLRAMIIHLCFQVYVAFFASVRLVRLLEQQVLNFLGKPYIKLQ